MKNRPKFYADFRFFVEVVVEAYNPSSHHCSEAKDLLTWWLHRRWLHRIQVYVTEYCLMGVSVRLKQIGITEEIEKKTIQYLRKNLTVLPNLDLESPDELNIHYAEFFKYPVLTYHPQKFPGIHCLNLNQLNVQLYLEKRKDLEDLFILDIKQNLEDCYNLDLDIEQINERLLLEINQDLEDCYNNNSWLIY